MDMIRRRLIALLVIGVLLGAAWWVYRGAADAARLRSAFKAVPGRVSNLSVPLSAAWDVNFRLPAQEDELKPYGLPVNALGQQADGTVLAIGGNGVIEVRVKAPGNDHQPGRLTWIPVIDVNARPPVSRIHAWRCFSDNMPEISELIAECRFLNVAQRTGEFADHLARIQLAVTAMKPPEKESGAETSSEGVRNTVPAIALTTEEVEKALRSGQSLESALAEKRRSMAPPPPPSTVSGQQSRESLPPSSGAAPQASPPRSPAPASNR